MKKAALKRPSMWLIGDLCVWGGSDLRWGCRERGGSGLNQENSAAWEEAAWCRGAGAIRMRWPRTRGTLRDGGRDYETGMVLALGSLVSAMLPST